MTWVVIFIAVVVLVIALAIRPLPCPWCGSRYSVPILLHDSVRCGGCWCPLG